MAGWDIDVLVSGSAIFNSRRSPDQGRGPAGNLEVITQALAHPKPAGSAGELAEPAGSIQEVADGRQ